VKDFSLPYYLRWFLGSILGRRKLKAVGGPPHQPLQNFVHQCVIHIILWYTLHFTRI